MIFLSDWLLNSLKNDLISGTPSIDRSFDRSTSLHANDPIRTQSRRAGTAITQVDRARKVDLWRHLLLLWRLHYLLLV